MSTGFDAAALARDLSGMVVFRSVSEGPVLAPLIAFLRETGTPEARVPRYAAFAAALNLGFVAFTAQLPLVTGNLHSVADCALIGLALAAFRSETLLRDGVPACQTLQKETA